MHPVYFKYWLPDNGWHLMEWVLYPDGRAQCWYKYVPMPVRAAP